MEAITILHSVRRLQSLKLHFNFIDDVRVQQLAEFCLAEQFAQLRLIDRERVGAAFGKRRVADTLRSQCRHEWLHAACRSKRATISIRRRRSNRYLA